MSNGALEEGSGSGYVITNYARGLRQRGHQVTLLGAADYEPFFGWRRAIRYRQALGMAFASLKARPSSFDVLEFYGGEAWLSLAMLRRSRNRSFLLVAHSNGLEPHSEEALAAAVASRSRGLRVSHSRLFAAGFRNADALVTVGRADADYAIANGYQATNRVLAIDNPLPEAYLDQPIALERKRCVGFCGNWIARKGTALLATDGTAFLRRFPDWRLVLVGVGGDFRAESHFATDILDRIEVVPHAARDSELRAIYARLAILAQPSIYESFGLVVAEAMACGCAVVSTRVGFARDLRDGEEVLHVDGRSPHLERALARLADDESLRRRLARAGHQRVQNLRWPQAVDTLERCYQNWLAELRRSGAPS